MKRYEVIAEYTVRKSMVVEVKDGGDPKDPADWDGILSEHDQDCSLQDVLSAKEDE